MSEDPFRFSFDLDAGFVHFDCGWSTPILAYLDANDEETDDTSQCAAFVVRVPELGKVTIELGDTEIQSFIH